MRPPLDAMEYNFTDEYRLHLAKTREEAIAVQHDYVGTEHLLLAICHTPERSAARVLASLKVDLARVAADTLACFRHGNAPPPAGDLPFTSRAKKAIELSMQEARALQSPYVGSEHLLVGLIREEEGIAAEVLKTHGVTLDLARRGALRVHNPAQHARPSASQTQQPGPAASEPRAAPAPRTAPEPGAAVAASGAIFISYRRAGDATHITGRIYDRLVNEFGRECVFKDVDSIPLGADFRQHLEQAIASCSVVLAVISPDWHLRLQNPRDFVRIEVEAALRRGVPIIPLFVHGAGMPPEEELPPSLHPLVYRNGAPMRSDPDFSADMGRLTAAIRTLLRKP